MQQFEIRKILAPTDFSEHSCYALQYARTFADRWGAELHLLNVIEPAVVAPEAGLTPMGMINLESDLSSAAEKSMQHLLSRDELRGAVTVTAVTYGRASTGIIDYARDNGIDLVVIATHGRTGLQHLFFGSTAELVVRECPCPVLTIHPPKDIES